MKPRLLTITSIQSKYVQEEEAYIWLSQYITGDGHDVPALMVTNAYKEPLITPTINLVGYGEFPEEGNVFIKDWSENEGILNELIANGIISAPVRQVPAGHATAYECRLLMSPQG